MKTIASRPLSFSRVLFALLTGLSALSVASLSLPVHAASVERFSPQGELRTGTHQATAVFDADMVALGTGSGADPFEAQCSVSGEGRWSSARVWTYTLQRNLGDGERCDFTPRKDLKALDGSKVYGSRYAFFTPGPWLTDRNPQASENDSYNRIDEDQVFFLTPLYAVPAASIEKNAWCEVQGIGERIPLKVLPTEERDRILKDLRRKPVPNQVAVQCVQHLPVGAKMNLIWGKGITSEKGAVLQSSEILKYQVREPFTAKVSCYRERPKAPCSPFSSISIEFSANAEREPLEKIRLIVNRNGQSVSREPQKTDEHSARFDSRNVTFKGPLPPNAELRIELPGDFKDLSGRPLTNAERFPVTMQTGSFPPLVKFAADFGILEQKEGGVLPVTIRSVEKALPMGVLEPGAKAKNQASQISVASDAEVQALMADLRKFERQKKPKDANAKPTASTAKKETSAEDEDTNENDEGSDAENEDSGEPYDPFYAREVSYLKDKPGVVRRDLPMPDDGKEFEVLGIPLEKPGLYVVELESRILGSALLSEAKPMYVRSMALVTNMTVHFKKGWDDSLVWVTRLDDAQPVAGADVNVFDCSRKSLWRGKTDEQGIARIPQHLEDSRKCDDRYAFFVSARTSDDYSFTYSDWNNGIEHWRFGLSNYTYSKEPFRVHSVLDRTMLRAGETVSMKHFARVESGRGFDYPDPTKLPRKVKFKLQGGEDEVTLPITWNNRGIAVSEWKIPKTAKLGIYEITFPREKKKAGENEDYGYWNDRESGYFRVSEFRLPVYSGAIQATTSPLVAGNEVPLNLQLAFLNGGPAGNQEVLISGAIEESRPDFPRYSGYHFELPREVRKEFLKKGSETTQIDDEMRDEEVMGDNEAAQQLLVNKMAVKLDAQGTGKAVVKLSQPIEEPKAILAEMNFNDPNGMVQTISSRIKLWPAAVVPGVRIKDWSSVNAGNFALDIVVLDTSGKPVADAPVTVKGLLSIETGHRKRIVGGFYAYESRKDRKDLGALCNGRTDSAGRFECKPGQKLEKGGNVFAIVEARDSAGRIARAGESFWVSSEADPWFATENQDRMDVLPEKKAYEPGETARFQVRTPFREATALISVEREGIIETFVRPLKRHKPVVEIPVKPEWGPNVYISVLAVRGRLTEVPWYSFFQWGWHEPKQWFNEWWYLPQATATVDLARPAYKLGITEIDVASKAFELKVDVVPEKTEYKVRDKAQVKIRVTQPDGKPVPAGSEIAVVAVDQALLELSPNNSWDVLADLLQTRGYMVDTSTAQMQVVGKRHFGKKALPAGGSGGLVPLREIFDTLLYWNPKVALDANGSVNVEIPLNDSLTEFQIVAIADAGTNQFGKGSARIHTTQEVQMVSGLPPLLREKDHYQATITVRNAGSRKLKMEVNARLTPKGTEALPPRTLEIEAGKAAEAVWDVEVPEKIDNVVWDVEAKETKDSGGKAQDRIRLVQKIVPAVPETVRASTLARIDGNVSIPVTLPEGALPGRGGIDVGLSARLADNAGLRTYFERYPYTCLEQRTSRALGLHDEKLWKEVTQSLSGHLDKDGFAQYFPSEMPGDDILTAYILRASNAAGRNLPDDPRHRMQNALLGFLEGRVTPRGYWSPRDDLVERKLAALDALSRSNLAEPRHFTLFEVDPARLPTSSLLDWYSALTRVKNAPDHDARLAAAEKELRNRLTYSGERLVLGNEKNDDLWWLMESSNGNAFRLIELTAGNPAWKSDMPRLVQGMLLRQKNGHWGTTTTNLWATLALDKFSKVFEKETVSGTTQAALGGKSASHTWKMAAAAATPAPATESDDADESADESERNGEATESPHTPGRQAPASLRLPWGDADKPAKDALTLTQKGSGKPWAQVQVMAAVPVTTPVNAGFTVRRTLAPVEQKVKDTISRGDIYRIHLDIESLQQLNWVVVSDPLPGGSTVLGDGGGRDSELERRGEKSPQGACPAFIERSFAAYRAYYACVPKGKFSVEYTLRVNNPGEFALPPTRVEALYAPDLFAEIPNSTFSVKP